MQRSRLESLLITCALNLRCKASLLKLHKGCRRPFRSCELLNVSVKWLHYCFVMKSPYSVRNICSQ